MKVIQPITSWQNGQERQGVFFEISALDNIRSYATISYYIYDAQMSTLITGQLFMDGAAYDNWTTNEYVYDWSASQLNLTIIGDFTTTSTTTSTTTII